MALKPRKTPFRLPAEVCSEMLVAIVDTREQRPLDLSPLSTERGTLATGDYSVRGLEGVVAIERKSLADLVACVGRDRKRFEREVQRLLSFPMRAVVVEASWGDLERGAWRGEVTPAAVVGSVLGWVRLWSSRDFGWWPVQAGRTVAGLLLVAARRRWREARRLLGGT